MKKMNSINETAKLCKENDIGISRSHLLQLAKSGDIPCVKVGQKVLQNLGIIYINRGRYKHVPEI